MSNHPPDSPELSSSSASPSTTTEGSLPLTASQRTKRLIVIQPIAPLEATPPAPEAKKKPRTGRTALTIEAPRPTTSLPPVAGILKREKKPSGSLVRPVNLALKSLASNGHSSEGAATASATTLVQPKPTAPPTPAPAPTPGPVAETPTHIAGTNEQRPEVELSPLILTERKRPASTLLYACCALAAIVLLALVGISHYRGHPPRDLPSVAPPVNASPPAAESTLGPAPQVLPKTAADFLAAAAASQSQGDLTGAFADLDQAVTLDPANAQAVYQRGLLHESQSDWVPAISDLTQAIRLDPKMATAFSSRAFARQAQGDADGALADYGQALSLDPKLSTAWYNEGLIKVQKSDLDGGIAAYDQAIDLDPRMAVAYYNRGNAKNDEGNVEGAIADYTQAVTLDPSNALAFCNRGFARQSKGDLSGALADYGQAIALDPGMAVAYYNRGVIEEQQGNLDGAIADGSRAIDLDGKNVHAYCNRGLARYGKGDFADAAADLAKFCQLAPQDAGTDEARLYLWLIARHDSAGAQRADAELSTALQDTWNSPPEDLSSKIAAYLLGHIRQSDLIAAAASPDPSRDPGQHCKVWYFVAMKQLLTGHTPGAVDSFRRCVATRQNDLCEYVFAQGELAALDPSRQAQTAATTSP
jgi:tetratricopeptide (TPR) repeat protein